MRKLIVLFVVIVIITGLYFICLFKNNKSLGDNGMYSEIGINYNIFVNYHLSGYQELDNLIINKLNNEINEFKIRISNDNSNVNWNYHLIVNYKSFNYKNYISYVFFIEYFVGGAHPDHLIYTFNYDTFSNMFVTINDLVKYNNNILNIYSKISRDVLMYNKDIVDISMMMEGTMPNINNYGNFVFSNNGIIIYFSYYKVAPYSSGMFEVLINYNYL